MTRHWRCSPIVRAEIFCLLFLVHPAAADRQADLTELRRVIAESRERVAAYELEHRGLLETVEALDRAMAALEREVAMARQRADAAHATLAEVETEAAQLRRRNADTQRAMRHRAVALYKAGELGPVRLVFAAGGILDLLSRVQTLRLLLDHDANLLERHRVESAALLEADSRARDAIENRDRALAQLRERVDQLATERQAKHLVVTRLHEDRTRERTGLVELEAAARALEETLSTLSSTPRQSRSLAGPPFPTLRHQLKPPVEAPIAKSFGRVVDTEFQTETLHKGVEFDAGLGTPVHAVAIGQVRFAGWFRGYGKLVILDHGDQYFTVSGHLAEIDVEVGDVVQSGGIIGTVGETGSLSGPRLYFEIRHGGEPQDPREWLESFQAG